MPDDRLWPEPYFARELAQSQPRERAYRSTIIGPHRDDLQLLLNDRSAAQYGSEGQKRSLAIAFKIAQADYLTGLHGTHVAIGVLWLLSLWVLALRGRLDAADAVKVEIAGLYWHFVDVVWIAIFTLVYLIP